MTETCQIYEPELSNCSIDKGVGLVEYRNMSNTDDGQLVTYKTEEEEADDDEQLANTQAEGDTSQQAVPESKTTTDAEEAGGEKIAKAPEKAVPLNASLQNTARSGV